MLFTLSNSAGGSRRARQMVKRLLLCFSLYLCWVNASMWRQCDNGKLWLEKDLPNWAVYHCAGTSWSESIQKLPSIETKQPIQPAVSVCMQTPIAYNHTIPSSGAHRPVQAETGEYLYCPPQRWLHNLQLGATVFLYHPCASVLGQVRLSVLAHSCLSHYIVTPHRELSMNRPFAMVSLGRVLELSHVTESEACDWLVENAGNGLESRKQRRRKYNLYLTRPAGVSTVTDTGGRREKLLAGVEQKQRLLQALRRCCMEALSWPEEEEAETDRVRRKKEEKKSRVQSGRRTDQTRGCNTHRQR
ncbi:hypothetical protein GJAV_G00058850 [Gymnothorax javanicus]|nr:hypothetical protein GJAV_G00058850 [Gymnothorax javanicus]